MSGNKYIVTLTHLYSKFIIKSMRGRICSSKFLYFSFPQAFSQGGDLRRHTSVAGRCKGEPAEPKPYACPHCGKGFSLKGNLGKHLHQPGRCRGNSSNTPEVIVVLQQAEGDMILQAEMSDSADGQAAASQDGGQYQVGSSCLL